jgi:hypothetical protein
MVPWDVIHRQTFLLEDNCWLTCNGGFCCSNNHPDFQFRLIPTHGTTILYMEDEYDWLLRHGKVFAPDTPEGIANTVSLDFGGPRPLTVVQMPCRLLGKCQGVIDKPLLCRLYPMFPILDVEGNLQNIVHSSIFELTMALKRIKTPCTVVDKRQHYLKKWQNSPSHLQVLKHPYILFYLQAAGHFTDVYRQRFEANAELRGLSGKEFWQAWELEWLLGNLIDADELAGRVLTSYQNLVVRYGNFF